MTPENLKRLSELTAKLEELSKGLGQLEASGTDILVGYPRIKVGSSIYYAGEELSGGKYLSGLIGELQEHTKQRIRDEMDFTAREICEICGQTKIEELSV